MATARASAGCRGAAVAAIVTCALCFCAALLLSRRDPVAGHPRAPASASAAPSQPPQVALQVAGSDLRVSVQADRPVDVDVSWRTASEPRELHASQQLSTQVVVPLPGFAGGLVVAVDRVPVDLGALLRPQLTRLLDVLRPLELETLLKRAEAAARARGRAGMAPATLVLPSGARGALDALGPLVGVGLAASRDGPFRVELLSRLYDLEVLDGYLERAGLPIEARAAERLPHGWAEHPHVPAELDRVIARLRKPRGASVKMSCLVNGLTPATEWFQHGHGDDWFNIGVNWLAVRKAPSLLDSQPTAPPAPAAVEWQHPATPNLPYARVLLVLQTALDGQQVVWLELNGSLRIPFCKPVQLVDARREATAMCLREVPPELLVSGRNTVRLKSMPLPGIERTSAAWVGAFSAFGYGFPLP